MLTQKTLASNNLQNDLTTVSGKFFSVISTKCSIKGAFFPDTLYYHISLLWREGKKNKTCFFYKILKKNVFHLYSSISIQWKRRKLQKTTNVDV